MKSILTLLCALLLHLTVIADCPHCFRMCRVQLVDKSGNESEGLMAYYHYHTTDAHLDTIIHEGMELIRLLGPTFDTFHLFDAVSYIPNLGVVIEAGKVRKVSARDYQEVRVMYWMGITGTTITTVDKKTMHYLLDHAGKLRIHTLRGSVCDEEFVDTLGTLPPDIFRLMIKFHYATEEYDYFVRSVRYRIDSMGLSNKSQISPQDLNEINKFHVKHTSECQVLIDTLNIALAAHPNFEYLVNVRNAIVAKQRYFQLLADYLVEDNTSKIRDFMKNQQEGDHWLRYNSKFINTYSSETRWPNYLHLIGDDRIFKWLHYTNQDLLNTTLKNNGIIQISYCFD